MAVADSIWQKHDHEWQNLLQRGDTTGALAMWSGLAEQYLVDRITAAGCMEQTLPNNAHKRGTGLRTASIVVHAPSLRSKPELGAVTQEVLRLDKFRRQLEQLARQI
eukprot:861023-Karenia_brevis.AAC.1